MGLSDRLDTILPQTNKLGVFGRIDEGIEELIAAIIQGRRPNPIADMTLSNTLAQIPQREFSLEAHGALFQSIYSLGMGYASSNKDPSKQQLHELGNAIALQWFSYFQGKAKLSPHLDTRQIGISLGELNHISNYTIPNLFKFHQIARSQPTKRSRHRTYFAQYVDLLNQLSDSRSCDYVE